METKAKVWGVLTSSTFQKDRKIILGRNFNQIETGNDNLIKVVKPKKYEFGKTGEKSFKGFPVRFRDV